MLPLFAVTTMPFEHRAPIDFHPSMLSLYLPSPAFGVFMSTIPSRLMGIIQHVEQKLPHGFVLQRAGMINKVPSIQL